MPPTTRHSFRPLLVAAAPVAPPAPMTRAPGRPASASHVRLRAHAPPLPLAATLPRTADLQYPDATALLDELAEDQLVLATGLTCLEAAASNAPRDASARAALRTLEARIADLGALRDALGALQQVTVDAVVARLMLPCAPLSDYVRGLYAWVHAVLRALDALAQSLRTLTPDWALVRWRLDEAKNFHFDELHEDIRNDVTTLALVVPDGSAARLEALVEGLFAAASNLEVRLDERFG